jgi:hypothetical protein
MNDRATGHSLMRVQIKALCCLWGRCDKPTSHVLASHTTVKPGTFEIYLKVYLNTHRNAGVPVAEGGSLST